MTVGEMATREQFDALCTEAHITRSMVIENQKSIDEIHTMLTELKATLDPVLKLAEQFGSGKGMSPLAMLGMMKKQ